MVLARLFLALLGGTFRETNCCIMKGYLITLRKRTYHRNDSLSLRRETNVVCDGDFGLRVVGEPRATREDVYHWSDHACWPRDVGKQGLWDVPLRQISLRTSSPEIGRILEADLDDGFEQWIDEPSATGVDKAGRTFQERIEVTLEDDGPEWNEEEAELNFWSARGKACGPEMEDSIFPEEEHGSSKRED
jgi:hypothetical protein